MPNTTRHPNGIPQSCYGVLQQESGTSAGEEAVDHLQRLGYAIIDSSLSITAIEHLGEEFNQARARYIGTYGEGKLKQLNELHTIRALLTHGGSSFARLALDPCLLGVLRKLIAGKFILNQQNGVINPPGESYNQGEWHRDLPYQHFVCSSPLAINALFCLDDFTLNNGATFVLPGSHKTASFPSWSYVQKNALQVQAKAGQFILLDCMVFHSGGFNRTTAERRAINHVYNIPYFKQQINIPRNMVSHDLSTKEQELLGFGFSEPASVAEYLALRSDKLCHR